MITGNCDVCGRPVMYEDDAVIIEAIANNSPATALFMGARHIRCSPSRAQFITDLGIIDPRPEYDKRFLSGVERRRLEKKWTYAYRKAQKGG